MTALPGLAALSVAYVLSQFFRTALAVVAPELAADLALDPTSLGVLSSAWFWAFAAAQLPIGVALDRWGPRRTVSILFLVAGLGCGVFAMAGSLGAAALGQILIGIGWILVNKLGQMARLQDCVMSGRSNCAPIQVPPRRD